MAGNVQTKKAAAAANITKLTMSINRIAANNPDVNGYGLRNEILIEREKQRIRYENGRTLDGYSTKRLFEDAKRTKNHRRTLARNLDRDTGRILPLAVCAHHIVASQDLRAKESRDIIFGHGIGINDAVNGVYLPRFANTVVPSMPDAPLHSLIHTARYHANVLARLEFGQTEDAEGCRVILRDVKDDLVNGAFPWGEA